MTHTKQVVELVQLVLVTPALADAWLGNNKGNRGVDINRIRDLMLAMHGGHWDPYQSPIRFGHDGQLIDGQHRLRAVCALRTPVLMSMSRQLLVEAFDQVSAEQRAALEAGLKGKEAHAS